MGDHKMVEPLDPGTWGGLDPPLLITTAIL